MHLVVGVAHQALAGSFGVFIGSPRWVARWWCSVGRSRWSCSAAARRVRPSRPAGSRGRGGRSTARAIRPAAPASTHGAGSSQRTSSPSTTSPMIRAQTATRPSRAIPITRWPTLTGCRPLSRSVASVMVVSSSSVDPLFGVARRSLRTRARRRWSGRGRPRYRELCRAVLELLLVVAEQPGLAALDGGVDLDVDAVGHGHHDLAEHGLEVDVSGRPGSRCPATSLRSRSILPANRS